MRITLEVLMEATAISAIGIISLNVNDARLYNSYTGHVHNDFSFYKRSVSVYANGARIYNGNYGNVNSGNFYSRIGSVIKCESRSDLWWHLRGRLPRLLLLWVWFR